VTSINLVISFVDPDYPTQDPLAKLSHTMTTQKMLNLNSIDNKAAWIETLSSGDTQNVGVMSENSLTSATWTLTSKVSPSSVD